MFDIDIRSNVHLIATIAFAFIIAGLLNFSEEGRLIDNTQTSESVSCNGASLLIRGVKYKMSLNAIEVFVDNTGDINLNISALFRYSDGSIDVQDGGEIPTKTSKTITKNDIRSNLKEIIIKSNECMNAQDIIRSEAIKDFGF